MYARGKWDAGETDDEMEVSRMRLDLLTWYRERLFNEVNSVKRWIC